MNDKALIEAAASAFNKGFDAVLAILPDDAPAFHVDGRNASCAFVEGEPTEPAPCAWRASSETLYRIFEGGRALEGAYLSGRLRISGDLSVMTRLLLESPR